MLSKRVRLGVARFDDGWNVVIEFDGKRQVYDPTVPTEQDALALLPAVRRALRNAVASVDGAVLTRENTDG